jgi:tetratricopeptide (TPR) repeat protein
MAFEMDELAATIAIAGLGNKYLKRFQKEFKDKGSCNVNKAHSLLYRAIELNPKDIEALVTLASLLTLNLCYIHGYMKKNVLNNVINEIRRLANLGFKIDPKNPNLHINLGMLYDIEEDHEKARLLFKKAGEYLDGCYWHLAMSTSYGMSKDHDRCLIEIESAIEKGAKGEMVDFYYGRALYGVGNYEKALIFMNKAYKAHSSNTQVLSMYSDVFYYQGYFVKAALISFRLSFILFFISPAHSFRKFLEAIVAIGLAIVCKFSKLIWPISRHFPLLSKLQLKFTPPDEPERTLAKKMLQKGHFYAAANLLRKATAVWPQNAENLNNLAVSLMKIGQNDESIIDFTQAIEINPRFAEAYINRGSAYYNQNNLPQAISDYTKAIEINPKYAEAYLGRGNAYDRQGNFTQAITDFTKTIEINPQLAEAYINRGSAYHNQNNFSQAILDFNKAIEINPKLQAAYNNRGNAYYKQGNFTQAITDYTRAIAINSQSAEAYSNRGGAYYNQNNFSQAILDYNKAIEINPKYVDAYNNRGSTYFKQGKFIQAITDFTKVIEINSNYAEAYYSRGFAYYQDKEYDKAWSDVHKAEALGYKPDKEDLEFLNELKKHQVGINRF